MKPTTKLLILMAMLSVMVLPALAVPTTNAATLVGYNNATLNANGVAGTMGYFEWGQNTGNLYWITPNVTPSAGVISYRIHSAPMFGSTVFYYRACDNTGCGNELSFTTAAITPIPTLGLGTVYINMTENGYDIPSIASHLVDPYRWNPDMPLTVIFMLILSPVFIGVWLRSRTVLVALILGFITGSFFLYANQGLNLGMPPEIVALSQAICYVAFAGTVLYIIHR